jgi:ankyrin repeat protein
MIGRRVGIGRVCLAVVWLAAAAGSSAAGAGDTRLADAAKRRDTAAVRALIGQKVDLNAPGQDGTPALHWAVRVDDVATARLLLAAGARGTLPNRYGLTPLSIAAGNGNAAMIGILLDAGADPNDLIRLGKPR